MAEEQSSKDIGIKSLTPLHRRKTRDVFFIILFALYWIGMFVIAALALGQGNMDRLKYGIDSEGFLCGTFSEVNGTAKNLTARPYLFYFEPWSSSTSYKKCVSRCPQEGDVYCKGNQSTYNDALLSNGTCVRGFNSTPILHRCVPTLLGQLRKSNVTGASTPMSSIRQSILGEMNGSGFLDKLLEDLTNSYKWLILSALLALLLAFVWLLSIQFLVRLVVWSTVVLAILLAAGCTGFFWFAYADVGIREATLDMLESYHIHKNVLLGVAITMTVLFALFSLFILIARKRIALAVEIIGHASGALRAIPTTLAIPIAKYTLILGLFSWCIFIFAIMATSGTQVAQQFNRAAGMYTSSSFQPNIAIRCLAYYYLFGLFWTWSLIMAVGQCTTAGAFATWYWTRDKTRLPSLVVLRSFGRTMRYHFGSLAFGSMVIAIVQFFRFLLEQLVQSIKSSKSKAALYFANCMRCCLACIEKFIKYLTSNAYIEIAIYGYSFCTATRKAGMLLAKNAFRAFVLESISGFILFLAKMSIMLSTALFAGYFLYMSHQTGCFFALSLLMVLLFSFIIAAVFISVLDMAIDTIFLCFLEDCERHDGSPSEPYYMPEGLLKFAKRPLSKDVHEIDAP